MVNTRFWEDTYISNLDPIEKLLFLYCITNTSTNICGIYEIQIKKMAMETGVEKDMVEKILKRFNRDKKIQHKDGWIVIKNFIKYQNQNSPKVKRGIEIELENIPKKIKKIGYGYSIDTLSHSNLTKLNSNLTKLKGVEVTHKQLNENEVIIQLMYNYELLDDNGNPIKKKNKRISKAENDMLISVGFLWKDMCSKSLQIAPEEVIMKNLYYPIRECYDREKFTKENYRELFKYFFSDNLKTEMKLSFDLCLSQKYVAKFKLSKKIKSKIFNNASVAENIEL